MSDRVATSAPTSEVTVTVETLVRIWLALDKLREATGDTWPERSIEEELAWRAERRQRQLSGLE